MHSIKFGHIFENADFREKLFKEKPLIFPGKYSLLLSVLVSELPERNFLIITNSEEEAEVLTRSVEPSLKNPEFGMFPFENGIASGESVEAEFKFFKRFLSQKRKVVVSSLKGLTDPLPSEGVAYSLKVSKGDRVTVSFLVKHLSGFGFRRVPEISEKGEFSVRGEIIDLFPYSFDYPVRLDFNEDTVEKIKVIDPSTMLSVEELNEIEVYPASFYGVQKEIVSEIERNVNKALKNKKEYLKDSVLTDLNRIINGENVGIKYYPAFLNKGILGYETLFDKMKGAAVVLWGNLNTEHFEREAEEIYKKSIDAGEIIDIGFEKVKKFLESVRSAADFVFSGISERETINLHISSLPENFTALSSFKEFVLSYLKEKSVIIVTEQFERVKELISLYELPYCSKLSAQTGLYLIKGYANRGFETDKTVVITDRELFPHFKIKKAKRKLLFSKRISSVEELNEGDYVVHKEFGIGVFKGLKTFVRNGGEKEFLLIEYRNGEKLYVPMERIGYVERYIGDRRIVPLNTLHGGEWKKTKEKAAENARMLAKKLLRIEAERKLKGGFSFKPFPTEEKILALSFPYDLTEDQVAALKDVYRDMEKSEPMDRLICGDVGYGKTEIAIRAAFRAVMNGKQVAFLVPTTVLALQHERTLRERLHMFPIEIGMLSRLTPNKEKKRILKKLSEGTMDIVVGTHRILSKDVKFKDLGLLIIDEEQRFGVKDKEKIKEFRANVDLLTLTATPIPRTLHSALINLKDISLINTPPPGRLPIKTFVMPFSWDAVKKAVQFELERNGQVFVIHNKIEDIYSFAEKFKYVVGETAKIAVAHGKMNKYDLEDVMLSFYRGETKILIATTIVENGLDIPTVNTLIVDKAENFGLSQMYQLRGRIGRSHVNAFAYFFFIKDKGLKAISEERLETIKEFTGVGSGIKIAMKDLELRGAGNLLGKEQHGHIVSVGYGMYVSLLEEAVSELRGEKKEPVKDVLVRVTEKYYIPSDYIPLVSERMEYYRRITSASSFSEIEKIESELADRFGKIPKVVRNLLEVGKCGVMMRKIGIKEVYQEGNRVFLSVSKEHKISPKGIEHLLKMDETVRMGKDYLSFVAESGVIEKLRFVLDILGEEKINAI